MPSGPMPSRVPGRLVPGDAAAEVVLVGAGEAVAEVAGAVDHVEGSLAAGDDVAQIITLQAVVAVVGVCKQDLVDVVPRASAAADRPTA